MLSFRFWVMPVFTDLLDIVQEFDNAYSSSDLQEVYGSTDSSVFYGINGESA